MNEIDTKDMITTHLHIPSTPFENQWIGGEDGLPQRHVGSFSMPKTIEAHIFLKAYDYLDYELLRDYLYGIFGFGKPFYVVSKTQQGKRHKVVLESSFMPERLSNTAGTAVIPFITSDSHYAESIGTTQLIERNGINANDEIWGFGMGLIADDESLKYTHTSNRFRIYNAGIAIHPYEQKLKITLSEVVGSTSFLQLRNITNGSVFRVNEAVSNQTIVLDGGNVTSNGLQYFRKTNHRFIELSPGWNEFEITGATGVKVEFDFPFYYK